VSVRAGGGEFSYLGRGHYRIDDDMKMATRIGFLAAGSGITPALQVASKSICLLGVQCLGCPAGSISVTLLV
jgi:hypothetical protein